MSELFLKTINISITASWLVLAVLAARLLLRKAPKWINVLLWGMVAVRLLVPISFESSLSLVPSTETVRPEIMTDPSPGIDSGIPALDTTVNTIIGQLPRPAPMEQVNPLQIWIPVLSYIWAAGFVALLAYTVFTYLRLRFRVREAVRYQGNVYLSENAASPFVLGILKPKIYLPYNMEQADMDHVIAHEKAHIRRKDHWWKPIGFLLLSVHWFNPLMWVAYILLCRDIELACDETVIKDLGESQRADYSQALLRCSIQHKTIAACPLAFGEDNVKNRIKKVLNYKKPAFWLIVVALIACVAVCICFLTDPIRYNTGASQETLDTMAAFLDKEGFPADISNDLKEQLEKYSYEGQKVSQLMFAELYGVGFSGTFAIGNDYGYEGFSQSGEDSHRICDVFYTSRELEGLTLPFGSCFEDTRHEVFQKIGITVNPEMEFVADKRAEGIMTLFANAEAKLTLHTAKSWSSMAKYAFVPECDYILQYEETHKVKKENGENATVTRTLVFGFLEETGKLGYVEIAINETQPRK